MTTGTEISTLRRLSDIVAEYDMKLALMPETLRAFEKAGEDLKSASCVGGTWGNTQIDTGHVYDRSIQESLLKSAWLHVYKGLQIERIASAKDKQLFKQALEKPAPFTLDNIRATFGDFIIDPWSNILRGLAEVFCDLDPVYKSHEKMKIGVTGLPKRIIIGGFGGYSSWGKDKLESVLNALAAFQGKPFITYAEMTALLKDEDALLHSGKMKNHNGEEYEIPARGIRLRRYNNGNAHLFFEPETLRDINKALSQYYGEVLADCSDDEEPKKKAESREVSKDLQYYPTPEAIIKRIINNICSIKGEKILEPSCGCGRFLDALKKEEASVYGIEVDPGRVELCRQKGHSVLLANFLETVPTEKYDRVVMNPPFYGKHYAKHVLHAFKFLKPGGTLIAVLPITARYDHGLLEGRWEDLPVGSFKESGTNINTTILTMFKER